MGFRDDFYTIGNIIGITGPIQSLPTVYFRSAVTNEYGHITQVHAYDWNQGRTAVVADVGYQIINVCGGGCGCARVAAHEYNGAGQCFHPSRSLFVARATLSPGDMDVVAQALWRCPHQKTDPLDDDLRDEQDDIYEHNWQAVHQKGPSGRRNAVDFSAGGLANRLLQVANADRL
jgi:hypothetical protein